MLRGYLDSSVSNGSYVGMAGVVHNYIPFYFGYLSPMMLNLKTGRVPGYNEGQEPLIYLVTTCQAVKDSRTGFVFTDDPCLTTFTDWFDGLANLDRVDWSVVSQRYWADNLNNLDQQRRKQAAFLVHRFCAWELIQEIVVISEAMKAKVEQIMATFSTDQKRIVRTRRDRYDYQLQMVQPHVHRTMAITADAQACAKPSTSVVSSPLLWSIS